MRPLKPSLKALGWTVAGIAALTALVWLGSLLYWHVRITTSLKRWKQVLKMRIDSLDNTKYLQERAFLQGTAGCRALPYAVAALDSSDDDPEFQEALMRYLISALGGPGPYADEHWRALEERSSRWEFIADGLAFERKEKLADFKSWWGENGRKHHAWWRTWSSWCGKDGER